MGNVISALGDDKKGGFVPYRDSKLTRLLQGKHKVPLKIRESNYDSADKAEMEKVKSQIFGLSHTELSN